MKEITLAIISDLHIGDEARAKDLCPDENPRAEDVNYVDTFKEFLLAKNIECDYLIIPGDIANEAKPDEFSLASKIVTELVVTLNTSLEKTIFVPGNHDADWNVIRSDPGDRTGFRRKQKYDPLTHDEWIFGGIINRSPKHILEEPYISLWEYDDLMIVGFNSSWDDDPVKSEHFGIISNKSIGALEDVLQQIDLSPNRLRLFLVHHHPFAYSDPMPDEPDFSTMVNSERLLKLLQRFNFDVLIHGHKHNPKLISISIDSGFPLVIFSAGSFSSFIDSRWSGYVNNQFHLMKVQGRDEDEHSISGEIESWTFLSADGWVESKRHNGIRHRTFFGTYSNPYKLREIIRSIIEPMFRRERNILWSDIILEDSKLKYLSTELVICSSHELC